MYTHKESNNIGYRLYISVTDAVTRARLIQPRAWAARVSSARSAHLAPLTAVVNMHLETALHARRHSARWRRAPSAARTLALANIVLSHSRLSRDASSSLCSLSVPVPSFSLPARSLSLSLCRLTLRVSLGVYRSFSRRLSRSLRLSWESSTFYNSILFLLIFCALIINAFNILHFNKLKLLILQTLA